MLLVYLTEKKEQDDNNNKILKRLNVALTHALYSSEFCSNKNKKLNYLIQALLLLILLEK